MTPSVSMATHPRKRKQLINERHHKTFSLTNADGGIPLNSYFFLANKFFITFFIRIRVEKLVRIDQKRSLRQNIARKTCLLTYLSNASGLLSVPVSWFRFSRHI